MVVLSNPYEFYAAAAPQFRIRKFSLGDVIAPEPEVAEAHYYEEWD
jgi:hypothetical protein